MSKTRELGRQRRHERIRKTVSGTTERPRLSVFRSLSNIYVQIIDDTSGTTVAAASSLDGGIKELKQNKGNAKTAKEVGTLVAQKAKAKGVTKVVFDRSGYLYHGRIKALADAAREAGLEF
ncbi:MAG: 50S ribosomal protein L18 [Nitrospirae bacterium]|nr:MAG: 50S ribosomal protein L18 [Nitrospirota bacterium]